MNKNREHITDDSWCWCYPTWDDKDASVIIHHSASELAELRRYDAKRFMKVAKNGIDNPENTKDALSWIIMQCNEILEVRDDKI